jgi:hypothetical protein
LQCGGKRRSEEVFGVLGGLGELFGSEERLEGLEVFVDGGVQTGDWEARETVVGSVKRLGGGCLFDLLRFGRGRKRAGCGCDGGRHGVRMGDYR